MALGGWDVAVGGHAVRRGGAALVAGAVLLAACLAVMPGWPQAVRAPADRRTLYAWAGPELPAPDPALRSTGPPPPAAVAGWLEPARAGAADPAAPAGVAVADTVAPAGVTASPTSGAEGPAAEAARLGLPPNLGPLIVRVAKAQGLEPELVAAVVDLESGFRTDLTQRNADGSYDRGLMQLNDSTSPWLAEQTGIRPFDVERSPYDPEQNLRMGAWYLTFLLRRYDDDVDLALLAYNAGTAAADRRRADRQAPGNSYVRAVERRAAVYRGEPRPRTEPGESPAG